MGRFNHRLNAHIRSHLARHGPQCPEDDPKKIALWMSPERLCLPALKGGRIADKYP